MRTRIELQTLLEELMGNRNVYYQPPESLKIQYPCVVYELSSRATRFADDDLYSTHKRYAVTVIDKNPDSIIPDKIAKLPLCRFNRHYIFDNLNHDTFDLYY